MQKTGSSRFTGNSSGESLVETERTIENSTGAVSKEIDKEIERMDAADNELISPEEMPDELPEMTIAVLEPGPRSVAEHISEDYIRKIAYPWDIHKAYPMDEHKAYPVDEHKAYPMDEHKAYPVDEHKAYPVDEHKAYPVDEHKAYHVDEHKAYPVDEHKHLQYKMEEQIGIPEDTESRESDRFLDDSCHRRKAEDDISIKQRVAINDDYIKRTVFPVLEVEYKFQEEDGEVNINRRECSHFVKSSNSKAENGNKDIELCKCGYEYKNHSSRAQENELVGWWDYKSHSVQETTNAFGDIEFAGYRGNIGKYIRVDVDTEMSDMLNLLMNKWGLDKPNLLISVTGGANNFQMNKQLKETFSRGLMKTVLTTGAWIVTGGIHAGVMKHVGEAVKDFGVASTGKNPVICIGIAPWGCILNRQALEDNKCTGSWPANYMIEKKQKANENFLDPNHTHFILVDDATQHQFGVELSFRARLENTLSQIRTDTGYISVPKVLLVLEGGPETLMTVLRSLRNNTPTVIVKGSGGAANILAKAYQISEEIQVQDDKKQWRTKRYMEKDARDAVKDMVEIEFKTNVDYHMEIIKDCLDMFDLMSVFELDSGSDVKEIDVAMLQALLKDTKSSIENSTRAESKEIDKEVEIIDAFDNELISSEEKPDELPKMTIAEDEPGSKARVRICDEPNTNYIREIAYPVVKHLQYEIEEQIGIPEDTESRESDRFLDDSCHRRKAEDDISIKQRVAINDDYIKRTVFPMLEEECTFQEEDGEVNIKRRECSHFIKSSNSKAENGSKDGELCKCGYEYKKHSSRAQENELAGWWGYKSHSVQETTNAFGDIEFAGYRGNIGKYIRVDVDTKMSDMFNLLMNKWGLDKPNLLISVTGGANNFQMNKQLKETFSRGLMKTVLTTGAWIVTGGIHAGVMKHVGEAVKDFGVASTGKNPVICIGIAPWGCIQNRQALEDNKCTGSWPANYMIEKKQKANENFLDPNHTHFILVDDATQHQFGVELSFRARLENTLSQIRTDTGYISVPKVLLVLEGGPETLMTVLRSLRNNTPTVIVKGSGGAADILAKAYQISEEIQVQDDKKQWRTKRYMEKDARDAVKDMVEIEFKTNVDYHMEIIKDCLDMFDLMSVFELDSGSDVKEIDVAMLQALLKDTKSSIENSTRAESKEIDKEVEIMDAFDNELISSEEKPDELPKMTIAEDEPGSKARVRICDEPNTNYIREIAYPVVKHLQYEIEEQIEIPEDTESRESDRFLDDSCHRRKAEDDISIKQRVAINDDYIKRTVFPMLEEECTFQEEDGEVNIKRRECSHFIKSSNSKAENGSKDGELCKCGYEYKKHSSRAQENELAGWWGYKSHSVQETTNAFGDIEFAGYRGNIGKYIRVDVDTKMSDMLNLLMNKWGLDKPNLLISVTGGANNFQMNKQLKETFSRGLMKTVLTTGAWIVTGGIHAGVMKHVGEAVKDFGVASTGKNPVICIGIAPWGCIQNRQALEDNKCTGSWPANYMIEKKQKANENFLDPNHTHFILVDDATQHQFGVELSFRACLENTLSQIRTDTGYISVPKVLLVLEGGPETLMTVLRSLRDNTPTVIVKGSGGAADILAKAYQIAEEIRVQDEEKQWRTKRYMEKDAREAVKDMLRNEFKTKVDYHMEIITDCLDMFDLMSVFELDTGSDVKEIDVAMLQALLKANMNQVMDQLRMALAWNSIDVAKSEIFTDDRRWPTGSLDDMMLLAIQLNRTDFVELFLEYGVCLQEFLTKKRLLMLYNQIPQNCLLRTLLNRTKTKIDPNRKNFSLEDVGTLIQSLMGDFFHPAYITCKEYAKLDVDDILAQTEDKSVVNALNLASNQDKADDTAQPPAFENPAHDLFIWSVLMIQQDMAKLFWAEGKDAIAAALVANSLLCALKDKTEDTELANMIKANRKEWSDLSVGVLSECYYTDEHKTQDLLVQELSDWGDTTCMQIAHNAKNKDFISQTACQSLLNKIWMGKLAKESATWRLLLCVICPPLSLILLNYQPVMDNTKMDETRKPFSVKRHQTNDMKPNVGLAKSSSSLCTAKATYTEEREADQKRNCYSLSDRIYYFFDAPVIIFMNNVMSYLVFLGLFTYVLIFDFHYDVSPVEIVLMFWVFTILIEEIRQVATTSSRTLGAKLQSYINDTWNIFDVITIILFVIGMVLRFLPYPQTFEAARVFLALNFVSFFLRLLHIFSVHKELGPKLVMIGRMVNDLMYFMIILMVFVASYAIASHSILYPNSPLRMQTAVDVIRKSYWNIYGELFLDEIEGSAICTDDESLWINGTYPRCPTYTGKVFVPILMAIYVLLANVLLLNLLIAMFSNTFTLVQDNTDKHWAFQRYSLIYEYYTRPVLSPPLIFFIHVYHLIKYIFDCLCCRQKSKEMGNDFRRKFKNEHELVKWENVIADKFHQETKLKDFDSTEDTVKNTFNLTKHLKEAMDDLVRREQRLLSASSDVSPDSPVQRAPSSVDLKLERRLESLELHMEISLQRIMQTLEDMKVASNFHTPPPIKDF